MISLISYNVNGLRAALKKGFLQWLDAVSPEVVMLQEIKAFPEQIDLNPFYERGYRVEFFSANKAGYSGVAIFSKEKPRNVERGIGIQKFDVEGRCIKVGFENYSVCCVYMPSGASSPQRQQFKLEWLTEFNKYLERVKSEDSHLIVAGDFNMCHKEIDIHNPVRLKGVPGFSEPERMWMDKLVQSGFIDSYREFNSDPGNYTWWSYMGNSRNRNIGWRIDYQFISENLRKHLIRAVHLSDAKHSDHCPVLIQLDI